MGAAGGQLTGNKVARLVGEHIQGTSHLGGVPSSWGVGGSVRQWSATRLCIASAAEITPIVSTGAGDVKEFGFWEVLEEDPDAIAARAAADARSTRAGTTTAGQAPEAETEASSTSAAANQPDSSMNNKAGADSAVPESADATPAAASTSSQIKWPSWFSSDSFRRRSKEPEQKAEEPPLLLAPFQPTKAAESCMAATICKCRNWFLISYWS